MQRQIRLAALVVLLLPAIHAWAQDSPICPVEVAHLLADDGETGDTLGIAVAVSGDTIVVGASGDDDHGASAGAVYVFEYDDLEWVQSAKLLADDGEEGDLLGGSVAIEGETLVVGARYDDDFPIF